MLAALAVWAALAAPVDANRATAQELAALPGIGAIRAEAIVRDRATNGPFRAVSDLTRVAGISAITLEVLQGRLVVSPAAAGAPRPPPAPATFDPNRATEAELAAVVGIGAVRAKAIVSDRNANGRYATCRDLARVPGLGPATVSALSDRCRIR